MICSPYSTFCGVMLTFEKKKLCCYSYQDEASSHEIMINKTCQMWLQELSLIKKKKKKVQ